MTLAVTPMLLLVAGAILFVGGLALFAAVLLGAWIMSKTRVEGQSAQGFFKEPKGEMFTIPDADLDKAMFPGAEEPSPDEEHVLKRAKTFLHSAGL